MNSQRHKSTGAAMVEFALILPILVVLVFGITELGRALYQQNTLNKAIASGVRYMSRSWQSVDVSGCSQASNWGSSVTAATNLTVSGSDQGGAPLLPGLSADGVSFSVSQRLVPGASNVCVISGTASAPFQSLFGDSIVPLLDLGPITLTGNSEERYHGN